jgi:hypothetical protein
MGGSANDYEYSGQDPVNNSDLDGDSYQSDGPASSMYSYSDWRLRNEYSYHQQYPHGAPKPSWRPLASHAILVAGFAGGIGCEIGTAGLATVGCAAGVGAAAGASGYLVAKHRHRVTPARVVIAGLQGAAENMYPMIGRKAAQLGRLERYVPRHKFIPKHRL